MSYAALRGKAAQSVRLTSLLVRLFFFYLLIFSHPCTDLFFSNSYVCLFSTLLLNPTSIREQLNYSHFSHSILPPEWVKSEVCHTKLKKPSAYKILLILPFPCSSVGWFNSNVDLTSINPLGVYFLKYLEQYQQLVMVIERINHYNTQFFAQAA